MDTRQKILDASFELFSQKGFTAISIRDICKVVGIKESTIYYYFKNKKEILDTLVARFLQVNADFSNALHSGTALASSITREDFIRITHRYLEDYLMDSFVNSLIRILFIEQAHDEALRALLHRVLFDEPIQFQSMIFEMLMNLGFLKKTDSLHLALSFYAPILYIYQQHMMGAPMTKASRAKVRKATDEHFHFFLGQYGEVHHE